MIQSAAYDIPPDPISLLKDLDNQEIAFAELFSAGQFLQQVDIAVSQLEACLSDSSVKGLRMFDPLELMGLARKLMVNGKDSLPVFDSERFAAILDLYVKTGIRVHSPGFMGRQYSGVVPLSGIVDFVSSILNQPSSFYEAAQLPNVAERIMAEELNRFIGFDSGRFCMITTSGGSLSNLTALLAARNDRYPAAWEKGISDFGGKHLPAVAMSAEAHYSLHRAIGIMGIGENQIVYLPTNEKGQIQTDTVASALDEAGKCGLDVFCLVASAGTTATGAFDPIDELADIATGRNIWFHVDGAHGGSLLVSEKMRHKLKGVEKADSLTWDAHKLMFVPSPCTLLFYKDKIRSYGAFHQEASYVFDDRTNTPHEFESAKMNFECTKRPLIMNLWVLWSLYGQSLFRGKIEYLCDLSEKCYQILLDEPEFEALNNPESNILCFRYLPANYPAKLIPELQELIRERVLINGNYFISKVKVNGSMALRVVFMNHKTHANHFRNLLDEIRHSAQYAITNNLIYSTVAGSTEDNPI